MRTVPDQFAVLVYLPDTVQRHAVQRAILIDEVEGKMIIRLKEQLAHRYPDHGVFDPVIVADHKIPFAELPVPANAAQQFMDRDHDAFGVVQRAARAAALPYHMVLALHVHTAGLRAELAHFFGEAHFVADRELREVGIQHAVTVEIHQSAIVGFDAAEVLFR